MAFPSTFIRTISTLTVGALGGLPRSIVAVTRETVTGFTPDAETGLIKLTPSNYESFVAANDSGAPGICKDVNLVFSGQIKPNEFYVLSTAGSAVTANDLTLANKYPRNWSFLTLSSMTQGVDDYAAFIADAKTINAWCTDAREKLFVFTLSLEPDEFGDYELPSDLSDNTQPLRASAPNTLTLISNRYTEVDEYTFEWNNPILAMLVFILYGGFISRSAGSLSDAHDFPGALADTFPQSFRTTIESAGLAQYNGAKDVGNSAFVYNTQMNAPSDPPTTPQIETKIAQYFVADYVRVGVRNDLQAAGQPGVVASYSDLLKIFALFVGKLNDCWRVGAIQTNAQGQADFVATLKSEAEISALDPTWQSTGVLPVGAIVAQVRYYSALHYIPFVLQGL
jgi:hypothetical protein